MINVFVESVTSGVGILTQGVVIFSEIILSISMLFLKLIVYWQSVGVPFVTSYISIAI